MKVYSEEAVKQALGYVLLATLDNPNITCGDIQRLFKGIESIHIPLSIAKVTGKDMACFTCEECGTVYGYAGGEWGKEGVWSPVANFEKKKWIVVDNEDLSTDYMCPRCEEINYYQSNYCPACGLKLEENTDD